MQGLPYLREVTCHILFPKFTTRPAFLLQQKKGYLAPAVISWLLLLAFAAACLPQAVSSQPLDMNLGYDLKEGQDVPPSLLKDAVSLSARQYLLLDDTYNLFFSNIPEFPTEPGILSRADDVLPASGSIRVLFSHMNLLIDWAGGQPQNMPATVGFTVENKTGRTLDVYAVRGGTAGSRLPDGSMRFVEDAAPVKPGDSEPLYYGSSVGNYVVREFYLSEERGPVNLGRIQPGERLVMSEDVGPRGWAVGIYDLVLVDTSTGQFLGRNDCSEDEMVGLETFIAPLGVDLDNFLGEELRSGQVLSPGHNTSQHMRGLFIPGHYPNNPAGEAVDKSKTINYSAFNRQAVSFALAAKDVGGSESDAFANDLMLNGFDPFSLGVKGVNQGNYGAVYTINLELTGPVALIFQGSPQTGFVDVYNQINTVWLDGTVKTVSIKDPNYDQYYTEFEALREPGYGQVIGVFPSDGKHEHLLRFMLAPNSYGPVRFYLLPLGQNPL